jgi:hypothetical protein
MHERQQPDVAEPAAHRRDHAPAIRGGIGEPGSLEQRERGALGDLPLGAECAAGQLAEQPAGVEPRGPRRGRDRPHRQDRHGVGGDRLAVLEPEPQRADGHVIGPCGHHR